MSEHEEEIKEVKSEHKNHKPKEETITITKTQLWQITSGILALALVASLFTGGFGFSEGTAGTGSKTVKVAAAPAAAPAGDAPAAPVGEISLENVRSDGSDDAPVTIIEYSDFQCPFCGRFYSDTKSQVDEAYVKTGKVRFVYKDFPLDSIHPQATPAALAAWCAHEQGKFWEYHDQLFVNQGSLGDASFKQWASDLGLDADQFSACLDNKKYLNNVRAELNEGSTNGIRGTPGFILIAPDGTSQVISGAVPFANFQSAIDSALQKV